MSAKLKASFLLRFAGGFVLGAIGILALQPAEATHRAHPAPAPTQSAR